MCLWNFIADNCVKHARYKTNVFFNASLSAPPPRFVFCLHLCSGANDALRHLPSSSGRQKMDSDRFQMTQSSPFSFQNARLRFSRLLLEPVYNHKASIHKASSDTLKIYTVQVVVAHLFYSTVISFGFVHCQFKVRGMLQYLDRPHVLRQWASNRVLLLIWQTFYALAFCLVWIWNIKITFVFVFWPTGALFRFTV